MTEQEKIKDFANKCNVLISESKIKEGDYCIIIHEGSVMHGSKWVKFIYKNISEYESKVENDIKGIDEMRTVNFEMWIFD